VTTTAGKRAEIVTLLPTSTILQSQVVS